jgi:hypothetical protein
VRGRGRLMAVQGRVGDRVVWWYQTALSLDSIFGVATPSKSGIAGRMVTVRRALDRLTRRRQTTSRTLA